MAEYGRHCVSIFSPSGENIRTFGSKGSAQGQFDGPHGVDVDVDGNILVIDGNHSIQKFTADGKFLTAVGREGNKHPNPTGVAVNHRNRKVYICDKNHHQIQILNADFTFSSTFGSHGSGDGEFNRPWNVAFDNTGNVYVTDIRGHCIQVFIAEGKFLQMIGKRGSGEGELNWPSCICIDSDDTIYVTEYSSNRISIFTNKGQFLRSFGTKTERPGQFNYPCGIAVDKDGLVYVSDFFSHRIQIY